MKLGIFNSLDTPENYHPGQKVTCFIINTNHFCDTVGKERARVEYDPENI